MKSDVVNRQFQAIYRDETDIKGKYKVSLKKDVFLKFMSILKIPGAAYVKLDHKKVLEMEYTVDKCAYIKVILETPSRNI